jgi:magnesium chelatase subunit D
LYIDEVNLLDDHLVDIILDAAASGLNVVEREGLSLSHPAEFTLIGTMNPEEGELRPQFLDRFGLSVQVESEKDLDLRVRLTLSREEFEANPAAFREKYAEESAELKAQVARAVEILPQVATPLRIRQFIAQLCAERYVAGHRADIYLERAAQTLTALKGRRIVSEEEVLTVAPLVLAHRQRDLAPPPPPQSQPEKNPEYDDPNDSKDEENEPQSKDDRDQNDNPNREDPNEAEGGGPENGAQPQEETLTHQTEGPEEGQELDGEEVPPDNSGEDLDYDAVAERVFEIGQTFRVKRFSVNQDRFRRRGPGRRSRTRVSQKRGRSVKSGPNDGTGDIALDATIRAAAPYQKSREKVPGLALSLRTWDIRSHVREKKMGHHIFFVVDASGSMGARGRMAAAKGAIMSILLDAYQKRDQVALVSFRRYEAALNLPLTSSVDLAGKLLAEMPTGGRTPLSQGLALTFREVKNVLVKNPLARPIVILITDGRGNVGLFGDTEAKRPLLETWDLARLMAKEKRVKYLLVDTEEHSLLSFNMAARLAEALGAEYFQIDELKAETLLDIVKKER